MSMQNALPALSSPLPGARLRSALASLGVALMVVASTALTPSEVRGEPRVGEPAPPFAFVGEEGARYESDDYFATSAVSGEAAGDGTSAQAATQGRGVVIAWFPKAFTPG